MARATNAGMQIAAKFQRRMQVLAPECTLTATSLADGSPAYLIATGGATVALAAVTTRSFTGFNVVGELSSSVGEGTPEHIFKLHYKSNAGANTIDFTSKVSVLASRSGCSSTQIYLSTNTPAEAELVDANLKQEIVGSDASGAFGA